MERRLHSFASRPFHGWYHKCTVCGTMKIWMPKVKCTDCKIYTHRVCLPTADCPSPAVCRHAPADDSSTNMVDVNLGSAEIPLLSDVGEHWEDDGRLTVGVQSDMHHSLVSNAADRVIDESVTSENKRERENATANCNWPDSGAGGEAEGTIEKR